MRLVDEQEGQIRVLRDERQRLRGQLDVQRNRDRPGAHRAIQRLDVFRAIQRKNAATMAAPQTTGDEACSDGVAGGIQLTVRDLAGRVWPREVDEGDSGRRRADERPDVRDHGRTITLPNTSRSSSRRMASADSARGSTRSMTGVMVPRSTSTSRASRSSRVQPLAPMMLTSRRQMYRMSVLGSNPA